MTDDLVKYREYRWPTLLALRAAGGRCSNTALVNTVIAMNSFTPEQLTEQHTPRRTKIDYKIAWARTWLKNVGLISNVGRSEWQLTAAGRSIGREAFNKLRISTPPTDRVVERPDQIEDDSRPSSMDRITKSYLDQFGPEQSLGRMPESVLFEHFANYCVISDIHDEEFDLSEVHVGGANDLGIDGLAIIVNGALVTSIEEAEDLLNANSFLDVKFIFIQAKTTSGFSGEQIGNFFDGVDEFFDDDPTLPMSEDIRSLRRLMTWLYSKSVRFTRQKPICEIYFVTTGRWVDDAYLQAKIQKRKASLESSGLFTKVLFVPLGANELQAKYQRSRNNVAVEFNFANRVTLAEIDGVSESYLGVVPLSEYLTMISDQSGSIRKPLFYDNVRDFQGDNSVNGEIKRSLQTSQGQQRFAILNNGVTVVARDLRTTGNKFVLTDYQIVNGCQTSHVLFDVNQSPGLRDDIQIPLKVIATSDEDIVNSIIMATNRQTQVTEEDLFALGAFQKKLEALFASYPERQRLFYERRSKQYSSINGIEKVRIVGKTQQVRAFAAMFLDEPHRAARYYSELRAQVGTKIFNTDHTLEPYYAAAFAYYRLEFLFRNSSLPGALKPARYHLLMSFRYLVGGVNLPPMSANRMRSYAAGLAEALWSDENTLGTFREAVEAVKAALAGGDCTRDLVKTQGFTEAVKSETLARIGARGDR